eukprot:110363-Prorocentrum_minimum.AAC.1
MTQNGYRSRRQLSRPAVVLTSGLSPPATGSAAIGSGSSATGSAAIGSGSSAMGSAAAALTPPGPSGHHPPRTAST